MVMTVMSKIETTTRFHTKVFLSTLVSTVLLSAAAAHASPRSGVTVAGGLGWGVGEVKHKQQLQVPGATNTTFTQSNLAPSGVVGSLAIGYDWEFAKCWILGFDFYGALEGLSVKQFTSGANPTNATTIKMLNSFGIRMRPGGMVGQRTMLHLTFGVDWSRWKARASGGEFEGNPPIAPGSISSRQAGFVYGCGVLTQVGHWRKSSLSVGLEYLRTTYKQLPILTQPSTGDPGVAVLQTFKPFVNRVMLRLVYKF